MPKDAFGRDIDYLRISVTDKCNYRCLYCMPEEGVPPMRHDQLLSIEETSRFVRLVSGRGIRHVRITGGEPLVKRGLLELVRQIRDIPQIESIAITTNGSLLAPMAYDLREAGVDSINISLDTTDPRKFAMLTRRGSIDDVLAGIDAAFDAGFDPVKLNCVVIRSLDQEFLDFAKMTLERPIHVRFIEFMPVGYQEGIRHAGWSEEDVIPSDELRQTIDAITRDAGLGELAPAGDGDRPMGNGPADYYELPGAKGTIGFISSVSNHFCKTCNRLRLTSDGYLRPCLFSDEEVEVKEALRHGTDDDVLDAFDHALAVKPDEHHHRIGTQRNMSKIGG